MLPVERESRSRVWLLLLLPCVLIAPAEAQSIAWSQRASGGPSPRAGHAMVYDASRGGSVLFGGLTPGYNGETWEWNGPSWNQRVVSGPSPRAGHAMAYDTIRGVTVLVGGGTAGGAYNAETWEWNGLTWANRAVTGPPPRYNHKMAFDSARGVVVLFGGEANGQLADTWEWDGAAWMQRAVAGPSRRTRHAMTYDAARGVTILFGGYATDTTVHFYADTWEWNGSSWTQRAANGPSPRHSHAMCYNTARGATVLFGGYTSAAYNGESWELGVSCYPNCDGSTSPPLLTINDFVCFQSRFAAGDAYTNCDGSTAAPVLTINDFVCFQAAFAAGCP